MPEAFFWGLIAAASLLIGAAIVAVHEPSSPSLGLVMGFGAGVLLSAVSFELIEEAITTANGEAGTLVGFFTGTLAFFLGDRFLERHAQPARTPGAKAASEGALPLVLGITLDGVPESAVIGLTLLQGKVGVSMLVAVFVSNIPESIAASSDLRTAGWQLSHVFALWTGVAVVWSEASALGYGLLDDASGSVLAFVLAFAAGAILCMLSTTMMPEAYDRAGLLTGLMTTLGFAVAFGISEVAG